MSDKSNMPERKEGRGHRTRWLALSSFLTYWLWRRWRGGDRHPAAADVPLESVERGHESYATSNAKGIAVAGIALLVVTVFILVLVAGLFGSFEARREAGAPPASRFASASQAPPAPRLQEDPAVDLRTMHAIEHQLLYNYSWVDREAGVVRIPIDRAMDLLAERGLPTRASALPDTARVPTESGFTVVRTGPPPPTSPAYLGSSREPDAPSPEAARTLGFFEPFVLQPAPAPPRAPNGDSLGAGDDASAN